MFERRGARTILAHAYAEPPFRIGGALDLGGAAYVIVVCTGPGVFAGDTLHQTITVARGAQVVLASQSALQAHPASADGPARIVHEYDVDEEAELYAHWDPIIPFDASRLEQRFELRLGWEGWLEEELTAGPARESVDGAGDAFAGVKVRLRHGEGVSPAVAVLVHTSRLGSVALSRRSSSRLPQTGQNLYGGERS